MTEPLQPREPLRPYADEPIDPPAPNLDAEPRPVLDLPEDAGDEDAGDEDAGDADPRDEVEPPADGADPRIAAAVARLDALGDAPPADHVEVYEDVHRVLQDALADAARGDQRQ